MKSKELSPSREGLEKECTIIPLGKGVRKRIKNAIDKKNPNLVARWLMPGQDIKKITGTRLLIVEEETEEEIDITGSAPGFTPVVKVFHESFIKMHPIDVHKAKIEDVYALLRRLKRLNKTHYLGIEISAETKEGEEDDLTSDDDESYDHPPLEKENQPGSPVKTEDNDPFFFDLENSKIDKESSPFREKNLLENQPSPKQAKENLEGSKSPKEEK
ncbi:MAG: hypothetical protein GY858_09965 [Candidatus Omnitrophica bacterium]|nr:hypothetical protein [Candidatus Omnitrophota bacterium]